jgi:hypothetical protein
MSLSLSKVALLTLPPIIPVAISLAARNMPASPPPDRPQVVAWEIKADRLPIAEPVPAPARLADSLAAMPAKVASVDPKTDVRPRKARQHDICEGRGRYWYGHRHRFWRCRR